MDLMLQGKTLFITGGRGGIGSAICESFSNEGVQIIAPTSKELDLHSSCAIREFFQKEQIRPDLIIHCAGINLLEGIEELDEEIVQRVFQVNLFSFMTILHSTIPRMRKRGFGRVIGVSSLYGIVSKERRIPYSASKHAMNGLIKSVALETASDDILINAVAPGYVMTKMTRDNLSTEEIKNLEELIPTGRLQEAEEIADLCLFLCSPRNRSITGQTIPVDGGYICR